MDIPQLQPLSFGELLDRVFSYYRRNFLLFFGIMAIPQAVLVAATTLMQAFQSRWLGGIKTAVPGRPLHPFANFHPSLIVAAFALMGVSMLFYAIAMGATAYAVSEIHLGRAVTVRAAYRKLAGRFWRIIGLMFNIGFRMALAFSLVGAGIALMTVLIPLAGKSLGVLAGVFVGLLVFLAFIASIILAVRFLLRYSFAICALVLENLRGGAAIRRSIALAKGNAGRIFVIGFLMSLITWTAAAILQGPFMVAGVVWAAKSHEIQPPFWMSAMSAFAGGLGQAATGSLVMVAIVLLYYDVRVRKEGFDLQLMMAALDSQSPEFASSENYVLPSEAPIAPTNIFVMVILTILTFGLYVSIWFVQKRSGLNQLNSNRKAGLALPIVALLFSGVVAMLNFGVGGNIPRIHDLELMWDATANLIADGLIGLLMVAQAFQVRAILEDHFQSYSQGPLAGSIALIHRSSISPLGTFFFGIFYLQYKINEMVEAWAQTQPALGANPVPAA